jgi:hypothetical protein
VFCRLVSVILDLQHSMMAAGLVSRFLYYRTKNEKRACIHEALLIFA